MILDTNALSAFVDGDASVGDAHAAEAPRAAPLGVGGYRSGKRDVSARAEEILRQRARARR